VNKHVEVLQIVLENLRIVLSIKKSINIPIQRLEFLGLIVDTETMQICLPDEKIKQICTEAIKLW